LRVLLCRPPRVKVWRATVTLTRPHQIDFLQRYYGCELLSREEEVKKQSLLCV
jgi:hypothetical protein